MLFSACKDKEKDTMSSSFETEFVWKGDTLGSSYYPKSALLIPIEPERECTRKKYLQLQTGVSQSFVYEDYLNRDSLSRESDEFAVFHGEIGGLKIDTTQMPVVERGYHLDDSIIGCVGVDFFRDKMVMIDFENELVRFSKQFKLPENALALNYSVYLENKILVPVTMAGEEVWFLCNPFSPLYVVFNYEKPGDITIGSVKYPEPKTQMVENANPAFSGILGHAFFKDKVLIFDVKNEQLFILDDFVE